MYFEMKMDHRYVKKILRDDFLKCYGTKYALLCYLKLNTEFYVSDVFPQETHVTNFCY